MTYLTANFEHLLVRINATSEGTLLDLNETTALMRVPTAPPDDRHMTLVINSEGGETVYLPGRVVLSIPQTWEPGHAHKEHHIVVEFVRLSAETIAAVRRLIAISTEIETHHAAA